MGVNPAPKHDNGIRFGGRVFDNPRLGQTGQRGGAENIEDRGQKTESQEAPIKPPAPPSTN
jgi:hypothetical protein